MMKAYAQVSCANRPVVFVNKFVRLMPHLEDGVLDNRLFF